MHSPESRIATSVLVIGTGGAVFGPAPAGPVEGRHG